MSGVTWTKFFWADWLSDPALRLCSYAARGLWMDMLALAASHDPIGYVAVAGRALDACSIARMTGGAENEVSGLLSELEQSRVFSRDRQGRIYSRRMITDFKKAKIAAKNGKLGGNPSLGKQTGNSASDNPSDNGGLKPHKPRASIPEERELTLSPSSGDFETWWDRYPKKTGKLAAARAYQKARKRAEAPVLLLALSKTAWPEKRQYIPNPATWLNDGRWMDAPAELPLTPSEKAMRSNIQ
jgi:hypothetical protein